MITVFIYTSGQQSQTEDLLMELERYQTEIPHQVSVIDISDDLDVYRAYQNKTPILETGPFHLFYPFQENEVKVILKTAEDRQNRLIASNPKYVEKIQSARSVTKADRISFWLTNHYMLLLNLILIVFLGLPFLAPVLERNGAVIPAKVIHKIYSPLCHQLAYRSWFLFGEQASYPRELAGINNQLTYEQATGLDSHDVLTAKNFTGNDQVGYKVAYCERDVAIYAGILAFGLLFSITGRRLHSIPWYVWIVVGMIPIGLDGVSQLPSLVATQFNWLPMRESTPVLRTFTGLLFGLTTGWYGFPMIEETMLDSRKTLNKKFALVVKSE